MVGIDDSVNVRWAPRFFLIWAGQALSLLGSSLVQFALVWWMTEKTGSATVLATATIMAVLPHALVSFIAGPIIDRLDRRLIMIAADAVVAAATAVLMLLFLFDVVQIWHVFVILAIRSAGGSFHQPAMAAATGLLVPDKHLTRVGGLNQALHGLLNIISPPLGAALIMILPTQGVLAIDITTALLAIVPLLFVRIPSPPRQAAVLRGEVKKTSYMEDFKEGFRYITKWPGLLSVILLAMLLNFLFAPVGSLMPLLITREFGLGAIELAMTETAMGIGVIIGGAALTAWGGFKRKIKTSLFGIVGMGMGVAISGFVPASLFPLLLASSFLAGFAQVFANGPLQAIMQSTVDKDMQGRVFSLLSAGATVMMPLSLLVAGPISDIIGIRTWYVFGGCATLVIGLLAMSLKVIMNIEDNAHKTTRDLDTEDAAK